MWKRKAKIDFAECPIAEAEGTAADDAETRELLTSDRLDKEKAKAQGEVDAWIDGCPLKDVSITRGTVFTFLGVVFVVVSPEGRSGSVDKYYRTPYSKSRNPYYSGSTYGAYIDCVYSTGTSVEERWFGEAETRLLLTSCTFTNPEELK